MNGTILSSRARQDPSSKPNSSPQVTDQTGIDRANDILLLLEEVCALKRTTPATERWLRHQGEAPYLFRSGRRLMAWRSDVVAHIEAQRLADQQS